MNTKLQLSWPDAFAQLMHDPTSTSTSTKKNEENQTTYTYTTDEFAPYWMTTLIMSIQDDYSEGICYGRHLCPYETDLGAQEITGFYAYEYPEEPGEEVQWLLHKVGKDEHDAGEAERLIGLLGGRMVYTTGENCMSTSFVVSPFFPFFPPLLRICVCLGFALHRD